MIRKVLISEKGEYHNLRDISRDFTTKYGVISKKDLQKPSGSIVESHTGKRYVVLDPCFVDRFKSIRKLPQTVALKEVGHIIAETGLGADTVVVDAGAGSGALCGYLARYAKHVHSFDIRQDHLDVAQQNAKDMGVAQNITFSLHNIYEGIPAKDVDLITLDVPEPWNVLKHHESLKTGGFIVAYSPCIPQVIDFVNHLPKNFVHIKTVEIIEKGWEITKRKVRPKTWNSFHTGFLTFVRKVAQNDFFPETQERPQGAPSVFDTEEPNDLMDGF